MTLSLTSHKLPESTRNNGHALTKSHKLWVSVKLKIISWPKLCFSSWALKWNSPQPYHMKPYWGTPKLTSRPEIMIYCPYLTLNQSSRPMTSNSLIMIYHDFVLKNPLSVNHWEVEALNISFPFSWMTSLIIK